MNKLFKISLFLIVAFTISCGQETETKDKMKTSNYKSCESADCLEKNKNKLAIIKGQLRAFTPNKRGKGNGFMFWDWEVLLSDGIAIPVVSADERIDLSVYNTKDVLIEGLIFYGIIIGSPEGQNATGYRIDASSIEEQSTHN